MVRGSLQKLQNQDKLGLSWAHVWSSIVKCSPITGVVLDLISDNWQNKALVMIFVGGGFSRSLFIFDVILFATSGIGLDDSEKESGPTI